MSTTTIHPSTSTVPRGRHASDDPQSLIDDLRRHVHDVADYQRVAETAQAENLVLRNNILDLIAQRDEAWREAGRLDRVLHEIQAHIDDTNNENRRLREQREGDRARIAELVRRLAVADAELERRGRHRRWPQ